MRTDFIHRLAHQRFNGWRNRETFTQLVGDDKPQDMAEAYAIQDELYNIMREKAGFGEFGGHKIALTSPAIQEMCGTDQPAYGSIFRDFIHHSPHEVSSADFMRVGVEFEVALEIGEDVSIPGQPHDEHSIAEFVVAAYPAFELIEDRCADYSRLDSASILTDRCWCNGIVLGERHEDWRRLDIANSNSRVVLNGTVNDRGNTRDALGSPLAGAAWISNHLNQHGGRCLKAGEIIMTGSALKTQFVNVGDEITYEIDGLGAVSAKIVQ